MVSILHNPCYTLLFQVVEYAMKELLLVKSVRNILGSYSDIRDLGSNYS
jgi:hypothetical protein